MVYRGLAQRAVSTTRPSISDEEEEMRAKAKASAANRVMQNTKAATIPSPMPTGDAAPTAAASQKGLVNTGPANTAGIQDYGTGVAARKSGAVTSPIGATVAAGALPVNASGVAGSTGQSEKNPRLGAYSPGFVSTPGIDTPAESSEYVPPIMPDDRGFRDRLEEVLMGKLNETPEERAQREAGRALVAARAQAGRGQMGMSGGMLALQSDVMGDAAAKAEDRLFNQQLSAGRIGTQMEALDKAERLGLLDYMESAEFESQAEAKKFLEDYLGMESGTGSLVYGMMGGDEDDGRNLAPARGIGGSGSSYDEQVDNMGSIPDGYEFSHNDDEYAYFTNSD